MTIEEKAAAKAAGAAGAPPIAPGSRILVRDCEWIVRRVDRTSTGGKAIAAVGISELVQDKQAIFLDEIEPTIEVLDPRKTRIVPDRSSAYRDALLSMESLLRQTAPTGEDLYIGHRAAMDLLPFQLDPAVKALDQPRPRILIADGVGLGKTIECGILLAELIRRGRGKRILVLAVKSMLTQFQKELWSRFTIPLTRLDSIGIARVRRRIPTNHNPFYYFDKSIISIDTLKQDAEYRTYLENAYWDVIVVDEAHNVALRGKQISLRAKLAKLLASRSDTLIMLSATPHDGKAQSFASLMNMLDPTAIANPDDYRPEDIKGLFIRRFKKDIEEQVERSFKKRRVSIARAQATPVEEDAYQAFANLAFSRIDRRRQRGRHLFKTILEKGLLSSPRAAIASIEARIARLSRTPDGQAAYQADLAALRDLAGLLSKITIDQLAKYRKLLEVIRDQEKGFGFTGKEPNDRLVIFTERLATKELLLENLPRDLKLKPNQVASLDGTMTDIDQQRVVDDFGRDGAPVRLLVASDVASEGINLHYLCHQMIHYDVPWSLMVFQQRNGRIDRYGQTREPRIVYLVTDTENQRLQGDAHLLELLIRKDQQAVENLGDPSTWMGVYDIDTEELITAGAIEAQKSPAEFEAELEAGAFDPLAALMEGATPQTGREAAKKIRPVTSLFEDDYAYLAEAIEQIRQREYLQVECDRDSRRIDLTAPEDLKRRFHFLPPESWPEDGRFQLAAQKRVIEEEIRRCRKDAATWPTVHYLWPLNPVVAWANDKVLAAFGRHQAPLITLPTIPKDEVIFLLSGLIPNRKAHPLLHCWFGVVMTRAGGNPRVEPFAGIVKRTRLGRESFPNRGREPEAAEALEALLPQVIDRARRHMSEERRRFEGPLNRKLQRQLEALEALKEKQYRHLERRIDRIAPARRNQRKERERRAIDRIFDEWLTWVEETMTSEDHPYLKLVAVLEGEEP